MAGPSLHLVEFVHVPERREGDGAALSPAVMAQGSARPCTGRTCLGKGSGGQEWAWKRGELTLLVALALTATEFWGVSRAGTRAEERQQTHASDRLPTFLQPCMGGWMAPVFIVTVGLIERGLICSNLLLLA